MSTSSRANDATPSAPPDLAKAWLELAGQWADWWQRVASPSSVRSDASRDEASSSGFAFAIVDAEALANATRDYQAAIASLWNAAMTTPPGAPFPQIVALPENDRRFRAPAWRTSPYHALLAQAYIAYADYVLRVADATRLPGVEKRRLLFMARQYVDAVAPTNFPATNPEVVERAIATGGGSIAAGVANLVADIGRGRISMSDPDAFEVGRNLAVTPGSVVYRNELIEVIQYAPSTPTVHARPLVIVPPCINKYYILDLQPSNSFVRHAVAQGHTTFVVSWRNIPPALGHLTFDDYLQRGVLEALRVARSITGSATVNALGFCVGGTLLVCALAVLAARGERIVESMTLLATMIDFEDPGEIGVYVTREFLAAREPALLAGGRLHGSELAAAFATLRQNDLVWNYVVGNYLKGETPPAFDLLHWNGDSAHLPGPMYVYYLREMYLENRLREPGALTMLGEPVDVTRIDCPAFVFAAREDHIVPWRSAYRTVHLLSGSTTFVLGASGHIAGVVNPPEANKRSHFVSPELADDPDAWLERARNVPGSWWPAWDAWLAPHAGRRRKAPAAAGSERYPPLDPAPGRYVVERVP